MSLRALNVLSLCGRCNLLSINESFKSRRVNFKCVKYFCSESSNEKHALTRLDFFDQVKSKNKDSYIEMVRIYKDKDKLRTGHVEFIYSALRHMKEFGVHQDLEVYKALIDIFPKGKMIPRNIFQVEFMHYPKHQQCAIDLLEQMEENGVMPDWNMEDQLVNVFGNKGYPLRRYWRMMYWIPKIKNASPWPLPRPVPNDSLELAKLAIHRITCVDVNTIVTVFKTSTVKDSVDDTWVVSGQSEEQQQLLNDLPEGVTVYVEGGYRIWLRNQPITYFVLRADTPPPKRLEENPDDISNLKFGLWSGNVPLVKKQSIHEQEDGTFLACCATGTSSKDSLLSWIRCLNDTNQRLLQLPVVFTLKSQMKEPNKLIGEEQISTTNP